MATDPPGVETSAIDRWDTLHHVLSSQERRMVLYSLLNAPTERRLRLPDAAMAPGTPVSADRTRVGLQHEHLPKLADAGYVRWKRNPFCVQRGPRFEEVEAMFDLIHESIDRFPESLIDGCEVYEERYQNVRD